ncbi:MAG: aspartate-semialdehyde dehydrogenase [Myxococcales bacterium]|nr:aspartate-semialdehyde dehydrogenase [Myxococcales bacterium]MDH5306696.1 aspartate-semialdehyde dehydrogenase [Myxococcales bacterium]MDH5565779.1 aspartate-semialdehyde dehydrogenase [Myxococcales bacterium]
MKQPLRRRVAVVGATGVAGQQFLVSLDRHPWFEVVALAASERSAGRPYLDAITDAGGHQSWACQEPLPAAFAGMPVVEATALDLSGIDLLFSAVESAAARKLEERYAPHVPVVSTSSAFRYEDDVPILVPGVNLEHAILVKRQQRERGWKGFVAPIPNCTTTGLAVALAPLARAFGLRSVIVTSLQALSGAGRSPGVHSLDILDNVIPFIPKEEEKVQRETSKILGGLEGDRIVPLELPVSAHCNRVNVRDGHMECVSAGLGRAASLQEVDGALRGFGREFTDLGLPSAPPELIHVTSDPYRPQPRMDRALNDGMTTVIGRLREDPVLPNGIRLVLLSHNTKMGAAKGACLVAEYLVQSGLA